MKCQAVHLLIAVALCGPLVADPAAEVREIRRLLEARGEVLDAKTLAVLQQGRTEDLATLRRQIQNRPLPRATNIGQGGGRQPAARDTRGLHRAGKLNARRKL